MQSFNDDVLGPIIVRKHPKARHIKFRLSPRREIIASVPPLTPLVIVKSAVKSSRRQIKALIESDDHRIDYRDGQAVGQSHKLSFVSSDLASEASSRRLKTNIVITIPTSLSAAHPQVQRVAQEAVISALKREAKAYLPRRLANLASRHSYNYQKVRYTHSTSRWGSCSSNGTISLNIALMKLPLDLIDYVLIHELCHTEQMNHSDDFWELVEAADPHYRSHRQRLKKFSPLL